MTKRIVRRRGGFITPEKYKTATANVVKLLSQRGQIAADLEDCLNTLIDRRNELMHRWILHKSWPVNDDNDAASYAEVMQFAQWVHAEANAVTHMMAGYMFRHANPDAAGKDPEAYRQAMAELFHKLHVQE